MADDKIVKEAAGGVRTHSGAQGIDFGTTYDLIKPFMGQKEVTLIAGTTGSNFIAGTSGTDIVVPNGASGKRMDKLAPRDFIAAGAGTDYVVLGGQQSDWKPRLPGVIDYPSAIDQEFWQGSPKTAYGRSVVLENVKDKSIAVLVDVEHVVFADQKLGFEAGAQPGVLQPQLTPQSAAELESAIKAGTVKSVPASILLTLAESTATPAQLASAKIQGTPDAIKALDAIPFSQQVKGDMYALGDRIAAEIAAREAAKTPPAVALPASAPADFKR